MKRLTTHPLAGVIATALLLTAILGSMVFDRVRLLQTAREIVLPITPVDPRDLFRGDYVRLSYEISTLDSHLLIWAPGDPRRPKNVFATLEADVTGKWRVVAVSLNLPNNLATNQIAIAGRLNQRQPYSVSYGIERYYVPEGTGDDLEKLARDKTLSAVVAIDTRGRAAIKGLMHDGRRIYDEPLW